MAVTSASGHETIGARTAGASPSLRVLGATITCLGRWGLGKTTLDDIAREAGVSRATVYRLFPGGKDTVVRAAIAEELLAFEQRLADRLDGLAELEDVLVTTLVFATESVRDHEALQFLLAHEPDQVLPHLAFARFDDVLAGAAAIGGPWLEPHLGAEGAARAAEWVARLVLSYALAPSAHYDLGEPHDARRFTRTFLLPGLNGNGKAGPHG
jgi:AcrR family transcriptional regulator